MSVVVRMEMPDWCPCVLAEDNNGWYGPCFAYNGIPERAKEFDQCVENMKRPSWCPIICSLPEGHGRLVDADEIIEAIDEDIELDSRGLDDMTITGRVRERLRLDRGSRMYIGMLLG